jgi:hypothetical protein
MLIKWLFSDYWPVRGQFSSSRQPAFYVAFFMVGSLIGLFGLYFTSLMGFMDEHWSNYQPYVLLSGAASTLMAWGIDRKPEVVELKEILLRALPLCLAGIIVFFSFGIIAKIWSEQVVARELSISELLLGDPYLFLLIGVIGAMVGATCSILADMCLRLRSEIDEIGLNISEYLLPAVGYSALDEMDKLAIENLIEVNHDKLPKKFINYLEEKGLILDNKLTESGFKIIAARHLIPEEAN